MTTTKTTRPLTATESRILRAVYSASKSRKGWLPSGGDNAALWTPATRKAIANLHVRGRIQWHAAYEGYIIPTYIGF